MSQKKVEAYKEYKKNKVKIYAREKMSLRLEKLLVGIVCLALVGWLGFSIYNSVTRPAEGEVQTTEVHVDAYEEYISTLDMGFSEES